MHNEDYQPPIGSNQEGGNPLPGVPGSYADIDLLNQELSLLLTELSAFEAELTKDLRDFSLALDTQDFRLLEAHSLEWPDFLPPTAHVSFRYYNALKFRPTVSSKYLRERWEDAARDVTGTVAIDFRSLVQITRTEAEYVRVLVDEMVDLQDSSDHRIVEGQLDWVGSARVLTSKMRTAYSTRGGEVIDSASMARLTPESARQAQAAFKVKLNTSNDELVKSLHALEQSHVETSPAFYGRVLGPAWKMRRKSSNPNSQELRETASALDSQLRSAIADLARRKDSFIKKTEKLLETIDERDKYRSAIRELSVKGKAIPASGPRVMQRTQETPEEVEYWDAFEEQQKESLRPSHSSLVDRDGNPHPQYLLESGGELTGDMVLAEGVKIDGVDLSDHRHTGEDSVKVHGDDIMDESLFEATVNPESVPPVPTDLEILDHREVILPPGAITIDSWMKWKGQTHYTYEVQLTPIDDFRAKTFKEQRTIVPVTSSVSEADILTVPAFIVNDSVEIDGSVRAFTLPLDGFTLVIYEPHANDDDLYDLYKIENKTLSLVDSGVWMSQGTAGNLESFGSSNHIVGQDLGNNKGVLFWSNSPTSSTGSYYTQAFSYGDSGVVFGNKLSLGSRTAATNKMSMATLSQSRFYVTWNPSSSVLRMQTVTLSETTASLEYDVSHSLNAVFPGDGGGGSGEAAIAIDSQYVMVVCQDRSEGQGNYKVRVLTVDTNSSSLSIVDNKIYFPEASSGQTYSHRTYPISNSIIGIISTLSPNTDLDPSINWEVRLVYWELPRSATLPLSVDFLHTVGVGDQTPDWPNPEIPDWEGMESAVTAVFDSPVNRIGSNASTRSGLVFGVPVYHFHDTAEGTRSELHFYGMDNGAVISPSGRLFSLPESGGYDPLVNQWVADFNLGGLNAADCVLGVMYTDENNVDRISLYHLTRR